MAEFISKGVINYKHYDVIDKIGFKKLIEMDRVLDKGGIKPDSMMSSSETFYDTPADLLSRSGIILSKVVEQGKCYLKIQKQSFIPQTFRTVEDVIFIHECGLRDKIVDHSLYLVDGITTLFATNFTIDFDNVFKTVVPRLVISTKSNILRYTSVSGFRANLHQEAITFDNRITRRKVKKDCLKIENISPKNYDKEYEDFVRLVEKHCKELLPITEDTYDYAMRLTKKLEIVKDKNKKQKDKSLDRIEG